MMKYLLLIPVYLVSAICYGQGQSKKFTFKLGTEYDLPRKTEDLAFGNRGGDDVCDYGAASIKSDVIQVGERSQCIRHQALHHRRRTGAKDL